MEIRKSGQNLDKDRGGDTTQRRGDTAHNTTYYSESWGDTAQENVFRCSHRGGDTAQNSETEGGTPHKTKVGCWLAGWLAGKRVIIVSILAPSWKLKLAKFSAKLRILRWSRVWQQAHVWVTLVLCKGVFAPSYIGNFRGL